MAKMSGIEPEGHELTILDDQRRVITTTGDMSYFSILQLTKLDLEWMNTACSFSVVTAVKDRLLWLALVL